MRYIRKDVLGKIPGLKNHLEDEYIVLDRNPRTFDKLIDYLSDKTIPNSNQSKLLLNKELKYWRLETISI